MEETVTLYFDGVAQECTLTPDRNGEILYVAEDGRFVKFPSNGDLEAMIEAYNSANSKPVTLVIEDEQGNVIEIREPEEV